MPRFHAPGRRSASLRRREMLTAGAGLWLTACEQSMPLTASTTPRLDTKRLEAGVGAIAERAAPGVLGVGLMNLESGERWTFNGDRRLPMQNVFKAPLGAAVLSEVDARRLSLRESFRLEADQLSPPYSPIADAWPARREYTARELLTAAVAVSDNTAADVLMSRIGGPGAVTAWLRAKDVTEVRVDRYERELQPECVGLASFRPEWRGEAAFRQALRQVPPETRRAAMAEYLQDPRDTATPRGMLYFLAKLDGGELLSRRATRLLLRIMRESPTGSDRLKAGLPPGAILAHKSGTARAYLGVNPAVNDVGVFTMPDNRPYAIAAFLSASTLDEAGRNGIIADVARVAVRAVG